MNLNASLNLTNIQVSSLIVDARKAEMYREVEKLQEILQPVWDDILAEPDYSKYERSIEAELLRLSGAFLTLFASSRNLKDVHLRAKDLLTKSIDIFDDLKLPEKSAESNLWLGFVYGNCGETKEYEDIYNWLEFQFKDLSPEMGFLVAINRLMICIYNNELDKGESLIKRYLRAFDSCYESRLKVMFYNNVGIIKRRTGKLSSAIDYYQKAIKLLENLSISDFAARTYNNLAFLYIDEREFAKAHNSADKSLQLFLSIGNTTGIPIICDTKAVILLAEGKFSEALTSAEMAVHYFSEGEDYQALTEAMWTKTLCLLRLDRVEEALDDFLKLQTLAAQQIGDVAVKKFNLLLQDQIYVPGQNDLFTEVAAYKKSLVKKGLIKSGLRITKAAKILGLKGHGNVQEILENQFPELYDELGMPLPLARSSSKSRPKSVTRTVEIFEPRSKGRTVSIRRDQIREEKVISKLHFENARFSFDFDFSPESMQIFHFTKELMKSFDVHYDAFVAVTPITELKVGITVLVKNENRFVAGAVEYDQGFGFYFIDNDADPIILDADNLIGVPVGYCPGSEADKPIIQFSRLKTND